MFGDFITHQLWAKMLTIKLTHHRHLKQRPTKATEDESKNVLLPVLSAPLCKSIKGVFFLIVLVGCGSSREAFFIIPEGLVVRSFSLPVRVSFSEALMLIDGVYLHQHFGSEDRKTTSCNIFIHLLITTLTSSLKTRRVAVEQDILKSQRVVALFWWAAALLTTYTQQQHTPQHTHTLGSGPPPGWPCGPISEIHTALPSLSNYPPCH